MGCKSHCGGWDWHGPHRGHFKGNTLVHGLQCVEWTFIGEQEIAGCLRMQPVHCNFGPPGFHGRYVFRCGMRMWMARGRGWQASTAAANLGAFYIEDNTLELEYLVKRHSS